MEVGVSLEQKSGRTVRGLTRRWVKLDRKRVARLYETGVRAAEFWDASVEKTLDVRLTFVVTVSSTQLNGRAQQRSLDQDQRERRVGTTPP